MSRVDPPGGFGRLCEMRKPRNERRFLEEGHGPWVMDFLNPRPVETVWSIRPVARNITRQ